jgi:NAD(P)-dependent dehydrogenase (short-subunit alcohol dehydrogenase family)
MNLQGRGVLITGANRGLGKAIAEACVREGAHVLLSARNRDLLESARAGLHAIASSGQLVLAEAADVSRPEDVSRLLEFAITNLPSLNGLVNNAGIYGPIGPVEDVDWRQWQRTIEVNLMGTVLMCRAVLPLFRRNRGGKIVNLSGGGATAPLPRFSAYAASKAAVVRFTETLAEETGEAGIDVNALAPGALNTDMLDQVLAAGPTQAGELIYRRCVKQKEEGGAPIERAAALCVFLLSGRSDGITGKLISAVWDPWESLSEHRAELKESDVYNLRRIVPKDRGLDW